MGTETRGAQVPDDHVLGFGVKVMVVQVLGKYLIIGHLEPWGNCT